MIHLSHIQKKLPINFPEYLHEYRIRTDDVYRKAREIGQVVEEYIKLVAVAKKYPVQAIRSADGILCLVERFGHDRVVLACQIAMESCMFGFNELESLLVNREEKVSCTTGRAGS